MISNLSNILKNNAFFDSFKKGSLLFFATIVVNLINFISIPIFTKILSVEDYGIVEVTNNYIRLFLIIFPLNTIASINYFWYRKDLNREKTIASVFLISITSFFIITCIFYLYQIEFSNYLNIPLFAFQLIPPIVFFGLIFGILNTIFIHNSDVKLNATQQILNTFLKVLSSLILTVFIFKDFKGRLIGEIIGYILLSIFFIKYIFKHITLKFDTNYIQKVLIYSLSILILSTSNFILNYFDTLMINKSLGSEKAGLYSFAYKISVIYFAFIQSFQVIFNVKYANFFHENKFYNIENEFKSLLKIVTIFSAVFILFSKELGVILSSNIAYEEALIICPIIVLGYFFCFLYELYNLPLFHTKKISSITFIIFFCGIVNIFLNKYLIPIYGYMIASLNTLFSYILMMLLGYVFCKYQTKYYIKQSLILPALFLIILFLFIFYLIEFYNINFYTAILIKLFLVAITALYLFKNQIKNYLKSND
jgi:O-antigen/teichoic acid export membrane protein